MQQSVVRKMQYSISHQDHSNVCEIVITGQVNVSEAIQGLEEVWQDDLYRLAQFVIFDAERCEDCPDFNELMKIVNYVRTNKPAGGPSHIAYYSSTFASTFIKRVLQGMVNRLPHNIVLFEDKATALAWFPDDRSDVA